MTKHPTPRPADPAPPIPEPSACHPTPSVLAGLVLLALTLTGGATRAAADESEHRHDIVIYGGTSAAVTAAVQATEHGRSVVVVSPDRQLGGLSSAGLGWTDSGNRAVIGGLAREFYHRLWLHYQDPDSWRQQTREQFGNVGQGGRAIDDAGQTAWVFEPHVAEMMFDRWIDEHEIELHRDEWLDRDSGVTVDNGRITSIRTLSGKTFHGRIFIDATYEGDLMAAAGVDYTVGREANSQYNETLNGIQTARATKNQLPWGVDPYVVPGDPDSGLLPGINPDPGGDDGDGDERMQAFCFRLCLTDAEDNLVPIEQPEGYDEADFELLFRAIEAGQSDRFYKFSPMPNRKTDSNNDSGMSNNLIGGNYHLEEGWNYAEAGYDKRRQIVAAHRYWQQGLVWTLQNHPRVPEPIRNRHSGWGLPKDEFPLTGHWPHQIYVREARRMVSDFVVTENHVRGSLPTPRSVGMGSYSMDSHNVQRHVVIDDEGRAHVRCEGDVQVPPGGAYPIDYGAIVPRQDQCDNLFVPVAVSATHIAFGSIRMEPVFMILGQSAATAADLALEHDIAVQQVDYAELSARLEADGQVLHHGDRGTSVAAIDLEGIVIDDAQAERTGHWLQSQAQGKFVGNGYRHDNNEAKGESVAIYRADIERGGTWEVRVSYSAHDNRATNVPVTVRHVTGEDTIEINQRRQPPIDDLFIVIGRFTWETGDTAEIEITNAHTDGHVIIDAIQLVQID